MRKEVIIAIILGFALGLVITFGIWTANKALKEKEITNIAEEITPEIEPSPTPTIPVLSLTIVSPEDESVQEKDKITLSGTTEPGAQVVILSEKGEEIVEADSAGKFESDVTLESGTNEITVTVANADGEEVTKTVNVVYLASQT